jgi:hypothetical protein
MRNNHIFERLAGIQEMFIGAHKAGGPLSSASKGSEREYFIDSFLRRVFPPLYRFGHGDATDSNDQRSGQLDVVVEYPFLPSLPIVGSESSRLYLAEGVGAVIEVKSNVAGQWEEVLSTANRLAPLRRNFGHTMTMGSKPSERIPLYAVGYTGWKQMDTLRQRLEDGPIDGILVIDSGLFYSRIGYADGPWSLWLLIACIHEAISTLKLTSAHPADYIR